MLGDVLKGGFCERQAVEFASLQAALCSRCCATPGSAAIVCNTIILRSPEMADPTLQLLLPAGLAGLPSAIVDLADILGQVAAALQLRDTPAMAAAALQAATDAQAAQDAEVGGRCSSVCV